ncbi:MAG: PKD domain-containing protein [Bacteroidetes bacterium]|nr:PKD domain-containing protein [Bacteroidota bacterium]
MKNATSVFKNVLILCVAFTTATLNSFAAPLNGTYTIDNSGKGTPNYASFRAAVMDLMASGVSGAVLFKVADGSYNESITIGKISGASSTNTITFQSASLDSSKVIIDTAAAGGTKYGYTVGVFKASYIIFSKISISNSGKNFANAVEYGGGCSHLSFENCIIKTSSSTSNYGYAIYDTIGTDNNISFLNNHISGGEVNIYAFGGALKVGGTKQKGLILKHNLIDSSWYDGIMLYSMDSLCMIGNTITCPTYALAWDNSYITIKDSSIVANNFMVSAGWGVWMSWCDKVKFYYNSVVTSSNVSYQYAAGFSNGYSTTTANNFVLNNIFLSIGTAPALYETYKALKKCDYNDVYAKGSTLALWNNTGSGLKTSCTSLSAWQTASKFDKNSISTDPKLNSVSTGDLHLTTASTKLLHKGSYVNVRDDIDGEMRISPPSIGADEVSQFHIDAAILSIDSPMMGFCASTKTIYATLSNVGMDTLKSAIINWSVNGVTMPSISWKGALSTYSNTSVKLDTVNFSAFIIKKIKVWTSNPNGVKDSNALNDTITKIMAAGLNGAYTIGGKSPDFTTFRAATNWVNNYGVCGAVVFNVRDGIYNESISVKLIPGSSYINTITFQSQSLDSNKVTLDTAYASPYYYPYQSHVVEFVGAQYVNFRKMKITNSDSTTTLAANVVVLNKGANHIILESNLMYVLANASKGAIVGSNPNTSESYITIRNNLISGGFYGIYFGGVMSSKGPTEYSNIIEGNFIDSSASVCLYSQFQDSMQIIGNRIYHVNSMGVGVYMYDFKSTNQSRFINNFVTMTATSYYGIYAFDVLWLNMAYNSIATMSATYYSTYISSTGAKTNLSNNNFFSISGIALSANSSAIKSSDYNNIYANGGSILASGMCLCTTIADWQKASGMDKHSVSIDPAFVDAYNGNLHLQDTSAVIQMGTPITITTIDVDGDKRDATTPDIGADENTKMDSFDIGVKAIITPLDFNCANTTNDVVVKVANYGLKAQTSFKVSVVINKKDTATALFSGKLLGNVAGKIPHDTIINIHFVNAWKTASGGSFTIKAYTTLYNDSNIRNDTFSAIYKITAAPKANFIYAKACLNDSTQFMDSSTTSAAIASYIWDFGNSLTGIGAKPKTLYNAIGKYKVQLKIKDANGCIDSTIKTVTIDPVAAKFAYTISGNKVSFMPTDTTFTHGWDFGDSTPYNISDTPTHTYSASGNYHVTLTATNAQGCTNSYTDTVSIVITGIENPNSSDAISIFPNPAKGQIHVINKVSSKGNSNIYITDVMGKILLTKSTEGTNTNIDISSLSNGMYFLHYQNRNESKVLKFWKG